MDSPIIRWAALAVAFCLCWGLLMAPLAQLVVAIAATAWVRQNVPYFKKKKKK